MFGFAKINQRRNTSDEKRAETQKAVHRYARRHRTLRMQKDGSFKHFFI